MDGSLTAMRADLTKVRQALFNLLSNAAKFTSDGKITLRVSSASLRDVPAVRREHREAAQRRDRLDARGQRALGLVEARRRERGAGRPHRGRKVEYCQTGDPLLRVSGRRVADR